MIYINKDNTIQAAHLLIFVHTTATETRPNTINDKKPITVHSKNHNHLSHWETNSIFIIAKSQISLTIQGWTSRNIIWLCDKETCIRIGEKCILKRTQGIDVILDLFECVCLAENVQWIE